MPSPHPSPLLTGEGVSGAVVKIFLICCCIFYTAAAWSINTSPIRMGLATMPTNLDPRYATDAASERVNQLLYQSLVVFDEQMEVIPQLATWQAITPKTYRFILKDNIALFSDGSVLDADDVKATFDSILDKKNNSAHRGALAHIDHINVVNEKTLDFQLKREDLFFPSLVAIGILPKLIIDADQSVSENPIGNGVFAFVDRPHESRLVLQRKKDGQIIEFIKAADPTVRVLKLLSKEIDLLQNNLPVELQGYLKKNNEIKSTSKKGTTFSYIGFNLEDPILKDKRLRQALAHAIDRKSIVKYLFNDNARLAETILVPGHWASNKTIKPYAYNPSLAIQLLKQAGYNKKHPLKLTFKTSTDPFRLRLISVLQAQLAEVGIELSIRSYDWGTFFGDIKKGDFQLYSLSWVGIKSPDILRYIYSSESLPPSGANRGRYQSQKVDRALKEINTEADLSKRISLYQNIQQEVHDDLVYIPLWYENNSLFMQQDISGYQLDNVGSYLGLNSVRRKQ